MSELPSADRSWWRQPPLWVSAIPLLIFLLVSAIDLALAKHFTEAGKAVGPAAERQQLEHGHAHA